MNASQAHAMSALPGPSGSSRGAAPADPVEGLRRYLRLETERLRMRHQLGFGGYEIASARSSQMDLLVSRACRVAAQEAGPEAQDELSECAVVALGGYGRAELAPYSDVDLLFLHAGRTSKPIAGFVERTLQLLWDAGLTVGHSFRSVGECVDEARSDLHTGTALTESRLIAGSEERFEALSAALAKLQRNERAQAAFLDSLLNELGERHLKFGRAVCVQEPNVKEGVGGLRDLHTLLWVGYARFGTCRLAALQKGGWLTKSEYRVVRRASDFLWRVRNEAHFATGRRTDLLTLDLQAELAERLGYRDKRGLLASESFMRDYYRRATEIHELCRWFLYSHVDRRPRRRFPALTLRPRLRRGFELRDGLLYARATTSEFLGDPSALLDAVEVAQVEGADLSEDLRLQLRDRAHRVDRAYRSSPEAIRRFLRLVSRRGRVGFALRAMHEVGILGRLLPEFARVSLLVQHDLYHRYTVDEHTLRALEALDEVAAGNDPELARLGGVLDEVEDVSSLYLGMLLHDIGKGRGSGHVAKGVQIGSRMVARLGLEPESADKVIFLIDAHLEMSQISQQRDLTEPALIDAFARRVGTLERLNLLLLLTYADHTAVGPGIWNEWKAALLWELYDRTRQRLLGGEGHGEQADASREKAVASLRREFAAAVVEHHFALLPERYLRTASARRMEDHFRLVQDRGDATVGVSWHDLKGGHASELTLVARDRRGLFAAVAGTLTAHGTDILSVDLFNRADGMVLDTIRVCQLPGHKAVTPARQERIASAIEEAVSGRLDVADTVAKWRAKQRHRTPRHWGRIPRQPSVRFDSEGSATATIVEVRAPDQPGLAYVIAQALAGLGFDITFAKIATAKALALDVFYVTDGEGRKLAPKALGGVEVALLRALGSGSPDKEAR